jgi:hypothetical protein
MRGAGLASATSLAMSSMGVSSLAAPWAWASSTAAGFAWATGVAGSAVVSGKGRVSAG